MIHVTIDLPGSTTTSSADQWTGATASFAFTGSDIESAANDKAIRTNDIFSADFELQFTFQDLGGGNAVIGFYPVASDGSFNQNAGRGGVLGTGTGVAGSFALEFTSDTAFSMFAGTTQEVSSQACASGDVFKIAREGTAVHLYKNGVLHRTWTATSSGDVRIALGEGGYVSGSNNFDIGGVSWSF